MKHILIINPNADTFSNPTLVAVLEQMVSSKNFKITILSPIQNVEIPNHLSQIKQIELPNLSVNWTKKIHTWFSKIIFFLKIYQFCKKEKVEVIIGIDPIGLIIAGRIKKYISKIKLHYFSFEIFFRDELQQNLYFLKIKLKEIYYSKLIDCLIIQDEARKKLLLTENGIIEKNIQLFSIPVSPNATLIVGDNKTKWKNKLNISENKIVLLHSGSIEKWSGGEMLVELLENGLPENYLLLIHSKSELNPKNPIHKKLIDMEKNGLPIILHQTVFSNYNDYLSFLQIADIGLALYNADFSSPYTGKNLEYIGLSSGKFACYLSQSIPTIVNASNFYENLNNKYQFGYTTDNVKTLKALLNQMTYNEIENKKFNAINLYNEVLAVNSKINEYIRYSIS